MRVLQTQEKKNKKLLLDKNDLKILSLLCHNVRIPLSKIAKLLRLSRQSVEYKIKNMEKNHLIAGSRTVVNIRKLGYYSYHFFISLQNDSSEKIFVSRCAEHKYVNALINYSGKWNYELSIMAQNPNEARKHFLSLISGIALIDYSPCILIDTIKASILPKEYVPERIPLIKNIKNDPSFSKQFSLDKINYSADQKDKEILYLLSQNAKLSLQEIGRKVKLTNDAVAYRIKKLVKSNYIIQFRPVIDYSSLNLSMHAILIKLNGRNEEKDKSFKNHVSSNNNIMWSAELFGEWDYLIYALSSSQEDVHKLISEIKGDLGNYISSYEILFAYQEFKYSFMTESMRD